MADAGPYGFGGLSFDFRVVVQAEFFAFTPDFNGFEEGSGLVEAGDSYCEGVVEVDMIFAELGHEDAAFGIVVRGVGNDGGFLLGDGLECSVVDGDGPEAISVTDFGILDGERSGFHFRIWSGVQRKLVRLKERQEIHSIISKLESY